MLSFLTLVILAGLQLQTGIAAREYDEHCYAFENDPYLYMASKTAYTFVHGGRQRQQSVPSKYSFKYMYLQGFLK